MMCEFRGPRITYIYICKLIPVLLLLGILAAPNTVVFAENLSTSGKYSQPLPGIKTKHKKVISEIAETIARDNIPRQGAQRFSRVSMMRGKILYHAGLWQESIGILNKVIARQENYQLDQVWLLLASIFDQQKDYKNTLTSLAQVHSNLSPGQSDRRWLLLVEALLNLNQTDQARQVMLTIPEDSIALPYAQYNLSTAMIKQKRYNDAMVLLNRIARLDDNSPEHDALRNRANMAIAQLQVMLNRDNKNEINYNQLAHVNSTSRQALLQTGWTWYYSGEYKNAIASWYPMQTGDPKNPMVQEALLAIPAAFVSLGKHKNAAFHYGKAIDAYRVTKQVLEQTIDIVANGEFKRGLKSIELPTDDALFVNYDLNPVTVARPFLGDLVVSSEFQNAARAYRMLKKLKSFVVMKSDNLPAIYQAIQKQGIELKKYISEVPGASLKSQISYLQDKKSRLTRQLMSITTSKMNARQRKQQENEIIAELDIVQDRIKLLSSTENKEGSTTRPSGSFLLSQEQLDNWMSETKHFEKSTQRYHDTLDEVITKQENYLHRMVLNALNLYKARLKHFMQQALYGKARVYDVLAASQDSE